jgi:uncharacterized cupredoxin-like copper-binding protein
MTIGIAAVALSGCSAARTSSATTPTTAQSQTLNSSGTVNANESDFSIALASASVTPGQTTIAADNQGPSTHELVLLKTDDAPGSLPVDSYGNVNEDASSVTHLGEVEDVTPGSSKEFGLNLEPGKYVLICNLPGHYKLGMYAGFTVG